MNRYQLFYVTPYPQRSKPRNAFYHPRHCALYRDGDDAFLTGLSACLMGERKNRRREKRSKGSVLMTFNNS
jgi:hypothetical protein